MRLAVGAPAPALLVPDAAVLPDQSQHIVMTVSRGRQVVPKPVEIGDLRGGLRVIRSGLAPNDRVIIDGHVRARHLARKSRHRTARSVTPRRERPRLGRSHAHAPDTFLHRSAALRDRAQHLRDVVRSRRARDPAGRPISGNRPADGAGHDVYPGASAETVARTVATPLEQEINGVENMLYMSSQSTGDGKLTITVTFRIGTDLNVAQMLTQNRVQDALSRLPEDVQRLGVQVRKSIPSILLAVHLYSPDKSRDTLYLSNYATLHMKDVLARLPGVGDVQIPGRSRICDAYLARSGQGRGRQSQRRARCSRRCAHRTCRSRPVS